MTTVMPEDEKRIVLEFCHLLEKSRQLFNGLRDLPPFGHKNWHAYFGRTFDTFSKLWKFQQQYRQILDAKYGLKRWQIGEIASKIGQLYYHYYLRTSETNLLNEAFSFYSAIRDRCYYTNASNEETSDLMVKNLRYYSRFIVVCILLNKTKLCKELMHELDKQVMDYASKYQPGDKSDWFFLIHEVKLFLHATSVIDVTNSEKEERIMQLHCRLTSISTPSIIKLPAMNLVLEEVLIVGCCSEQVKISEMSMDMYRMIQMMEREPDASIRDVSPTSRHDPTSPEPIKMKGCLHGGIRRSPHKYLLQQPSMTHLLTYAASCCNELTANGVLLFYISAEGWMSPGNSSSIDVSYERGGVLTNNCDIRDGFRINDRPYLRKERCLHPGDLLPFTRHPMVVIVESDNASIFQYLPRPFSQPLLILMAPQQLPPYFQSHQHNGSLFTFFLHQPLIGFLHTCDVTTINSGMLSGAQQFLDTYLLEAYRLMTRCRIDPTFIQLLGDEFLRLLILRFIFCSTVMHMHVLFRDRSHWPRSSPTMPENELISHPTLVDIILEMASYFELSSHFHDPVLHT